jgi:DNA (cytosine-5)-methyltransferase 1
MVGQIETVAFCEREAYAQRVLKKHWPDVPICDDIHNLKGNDYGPIDLVTGGFPCQPYSLAGERRGNDDDRALWPQMLRVIREARPTWVIGENVPGIISLALDGVLADLESAGYACETFALPACAVDAKHRRNRVWIVAHCSQFFGNGRRVGEHPITGEIQLSAGRESGDVSNTHDRLDEARRASSNKRNVENGNGTAYGSRRDWLPEPDVGRVAHGIPARVDRLRGLGNAIVPQVAAALLSKIVEVHYGTVAWHNA